MTYRQTAPRLWLMTDERIGDLAAAIGRLPKGAGVIFRHHATPPPARRALYECVRAIARRRRLMLVLAGPPGLAIAWRADGAHGRSPHRTAARALLRTAPAHDAREIVAGVRAGADLILLSPLFATRSHPGAFALGRVRFGLLARGVRLRGRGCGAGPYPATSRWPYAGGDGPGDPAGPARGRIVALGGMDADRFRSARALGACGWAAIDAWGRVIESDLSPRWGPEHRAVAG